MPTSEKQAIVAEIKERFDASEGVILADYRGLNVKQMQELRVRLREADGDIKIFKNTLTLIALRELELPDMEALFDGPTAIVFIGEDPVAPAKALVDFAKQNKALEVKGGFIDRVVVTGDAVKAIAALPSREELVAKLMGMLLNPVRGFMAMANAPAGAFTRAVKAVADQKAAA